MARVRFNPPQNEAWEAFNSYMSSLDKDRVDEEKAAPTLSPNTIDLINSQTDSNNLPIRQERVIPQDSIEGYNNIIQTNKEEEPIVSSQLGAEYTLDQLEENPEFSMRAERFMEEIGDDEDIFEYLRDINFSLSSALVRSGQIKGWSDQAKEDYIYLKESFDKASVGGLKQGLRMAKDVSIDLIRDPLNLAAMAFAPVTMGESLAARAAIQVAVRQGLKKTAKAKLKHRILGKKAGESAVGKPALYGAVEGAVWAGPHDYFLQQGDVELGLRDDVDLTSVALSTALGAGFTGIMTGSIGLMTAASPLVFRKMARTSDEVSILNATSSKRAVLDDYDNHIDWRAVDDTGYNPKLDPEFKRTKTQFEEEKILEEHKDNAFNSFTDKILKTTATTIGKSVTRFRERAKQSHTLGVLLGHFRYDWYRSVFNPSRMLEEFSFGESMNSLKAKWQTDLEDALFSIHRTGYKTEKSWLPSFTWKGLDHKENKMLIHRIIDDRKTQIEWQGELIDITDGVKKAANKIQKINSEIHDELVKQDLLAPDAKLENYFARKLQHDAIADNRDLFKKYLITFGRLDEEGKKKLRAVENIKDNWEGKEVQKILDEHLIDGAYAKPRNDFDDKVFEEYYNEYGELVKGIPKRARPIDQEVYGVNFLDKTNADNDIILGTSLKADVIIDDILENRYNVFETRSSTGPMVPSLRGPSEGPIGGATGFLKPRIFEDIPDELMLPFMDIRVENVMNEYMTSAALLTKREQFFGRSVDVFNKRWLQPIKQELRESGMDPEMVKETEKLLLKYYERIGGVSLPTPFGTGKGRLLVDIAKLSQQLAHLPLATVSSLTEPLILISRIRADDTPMAAFDIGTSLAKETRKIFTNLGRGVKRQLGGKHLGPKEFDPLNPDFQWQEAYRVGLALEQAVMDRLEGLYGGGSTNNTVNRIARGFFKTTLLSQWTAAVQLASFTTGKRLILQNAKQLSTGKTLGGRTLSKPYQKRLMDEVKGLGQDVRIGKDGKARGALIEWYESSLVDGEFNLLRAKELDFYDNNYLRGANRFAREIILNPDVTEGNKPLWYTHPAGQALTQFASYPTAFNNTVLKRFASEIFRDAQDKRLISSPKIVSAAVLMTATAAFTNAIRSGGTSLEKEPNEILIDAVDRWGGLGPLVYAHRFKENAELGGGMIGSLAKAPTGPLAQDALDSILFRKGIAEVLASNVPFYSALPWEARKALRKEGKSIDDALWGTKESGKAKELAKFYNPFPDIKTTDVRYYAAKGGVVTNVPQVKEEPDERIDRMTGLPYHMQAGVLGQDVEDRFGFAEGGVVGKKEQEIYAFLTKDLRKQAPILEDNSFINGYDEKELKEEALGIKEPMYREIKENTNYQDLVDFRDSETIGVHVSSDPSINSLKGYVTLTNPLDISDIDAPLEGFEFIEEIENNKELKNKIFDNSLADSNTTKEYIDHLLFEHSMRKQVINKKENLPQLNKILNVVSSHKIRETFKDIGYDGIIYENMASDIIDNQMGRLGFALGGIAKLLSSFLIKRTPLRKIISGGQTGVDELGLKAGSEIGYETGGTMPKGFRTDAGDEYGKTVATKYGLEEHVERSYKPRTVQNVVDSDGTVIFTVVNKQGRIDSKGSRLTRNTAEQKKKPYIINPTSDELAKWLLNNKIKTLNIAGNRMSILKRKENAGLFKNFESVLKWGILKSGGIKNKNQLNTIIGKKTTTKTSKKAIVFDKGQHKPVLKTDAEIKQAMADKPKTLWIFADNETRGGFTDVAGSSAARARGLPNTLGIRVKATPSGKNQYWKETSNKIRQGHIQKVNDDIAEIYRAVGSNKYDKVIISPEIQKTFYMGKSPIVSKLVFGKLKNLKGWSKSYLDPENKKLAEQIGADITKASPEVERKIGELYGSRYVPKHTQFIKDKTGKVVEERMEPAIVDPFSKTATQKSAVTGSVVMDRPRGAKARDVGVPEDEALYAKGHTDEIKKLKVRDPVPTDYEEFKNYIKKLEAPEPITRIENGKTIVVYKDPSSYNLELAEELKLTWMKEHPELPFPDDWIPKGKK